jgi:hypothetical protein
MHLFTDRLASILLNTSLHVHAVVALGSHSVHTLSPCAGHCIHFQLIATLHAWRKIATWRIVKIDVKEYVNYKDDCNTVYEY